MNLTINEQLMIDTKDANICIFVANLAGWIRTNARKDTPNQRNIYEGRCWSYNSIQEFVRYFGFWSTKNIRTIIANCIKLDLITTSSFNKKKYDNTLWYTLTDKGLDYYPHVRDLVLNRLADSGKTLADSGKPIPELPYQSSNNTITTNVSDETSNSKISNQEVIDCYHEHLPELTRIKVVDRDLSNKINSMKKNWPKYQKDGKEFTINLFVDFLQFIKKHHSWFLKPRVTEGGNIRKNSLRNLIAEINLARFANGEFSAS